MGLNLGLAGIGLASGLREYERLTDKERAQKREDQRFDWESKRAEAEMGLLADKSEAERSGYQLRGKQNSTELDLVDKRGDVAGKELDQKQKDLALADSLRSTTDQTKQKQAELGLKQADGNLELYPQMLVDQKQKGFITEVEQQRQFMNMLADKAHAGDYGNFAVLLNGWNKANGGKGANIANVKEQDGVLVAYGDDGKPIITPNGQQLIFSKNVLDQYRSKPKVEKVNPGDTLGYYDGNKWHSVFTAPESPSKAAEKMGGTEKDFRFWTSLGYSQEQAVEMMRSGKVPSEESIMQKLIENDAMSGKGVTPEAIEKARETARQIRQSSSVRQQSTRPGGDPPPAVGKLLNSLKGNPTPPAATPIPRNGNPTATLGDLFRNPTPPR